MSLTPLAPFIVIFIIGVLFIAWIIYLITSLVVSQRRQAQAQEKMAQAHSDIAQYLAQRPPE